MIYFSFLFPGDLDKWGRHGNVEGRHGNVELEVAIQLMIIDTPQY